ncbi:MAG: RNA polymerase sigma factor [Steroidobacteraceae bacterium]
MTRSTSIPPATDLPSDRALVEQSLGGDRHAFATLIARHGDGLYQFAIRHVPQRADAHDVVQDTFIAAWQALRSYDPDRPLYVWLRSILFNRCRDLARKAAVRRILVLFGAGDPQQIEAVADPAPHAEVALTQAAALRRFEAALNSLPHALREPLVLTQWDGLSAREAAELLGTNARAVENRIYKARKKLATLLQPEDLQDLGESP